jgi:hypothetical protein
LSEPAASHIPLYVDPDTGILESNPHHMRFARRLRLERAAREAAAHGRLKRLAPKLVLVLLDDGNWWEVRLATTPWAWSRDGVRAADAVDVVERAGLSALSRDLRYGAQGVHAIAKRPLSKRELKRHALR